MSDPPFILVFEPTDVLDLRLNWHKFQQAAEHGDDLYWNREGCIRVFPNGALVRACETYADWCRQSDVTGGLIPAKAREIRWEDLPLSPHEPSIVSNSTTL